jgi:hypothetical protein
MPDPRHLNSTRMLPKVFPDFGGSYPGTGPKCRKISRRGPGPPQAPFAHSPVLHSLPIPAGAQEDPGVPEDTSGNPPHACCESILYLHVTVDVSLQPKGHKSAVKWGLDLSGSCTRPPSEVILHLTNTFSRSIQDCGRGQPEPPQASGHGICGRETGLRGGLDFKREKSIKMTREDSLVSHAALKWQLSPFLEYSSKDKPQMENHKAVSTKSSRLGFNLRNCLQLVIFANKGARLIRTGQPWTVRSALNKCWCRSKLFTHLMSLNPSACSVR